MLARSAAVLARGQTCHCVRGQPLLPAGAALASPAPRHCGWYRPITSTGSPQAGHSHWANIKHKKGRKDEEKSERNRKLLLSVITAARVGGADFSSNPALANAVDKAHAANISKDKIEAAIQKADPCKGGEAMEELTFEGTFPAGLGVLVEAISDNKNRTVQEVKLVFSESGGTVSSGGFVRQMFTKMGVVEISNLTDEEKDVVEEGAMGDLPVEDVLTDDEIMRLVCSPQDVYLVKERVQHMLRDARDSDAAPVVSASVYNLLKDPEGAVEVHEDEEPSLMVGKKKKETMKTRYEAYSKAIEDLDALPDVKSVSHNILFVDDDDD